MNLKMQVQQLHKRAEELGLETKGLKAILIDWLNQDNSDEDNSDDSKKIMKMRRIARIILKMIKKLK